MVKRKTAQCLTKRTAHCDAFDGSSKREDGATVRPCDRESMPVVRAEGGVAVAAV